MSFSKAELLASQKDYRRLIKSLTEGQAEQLRWDWSFWGRPEQMEPPGMWTTWLVMAGRGFGKTRAGAEWVRANVCGATPKAPGRYNRVALVAETAADARDVMVEGESGLLAVHPPAFRPLYEPSKRRVTWANGAVATLYNATEPDQLRGPQHDLAWCDETAKWRYAQETWDMLQFGLRLGDLPRVLVTTTPRPIKLIRELMADPSCVTTRGGTNDNRNNLAPSFLAQIQAKYAGTRLGRQELDAEILDDAPNALWVRATIDLHRRTLNSLPPMKRIVVAIDPAAKSNERADDGAATGIIAAAMGEDGRGYILEDATIRGSPNAWARRAVALYDQLEADCIVAETNQGGDMVAATIRSVRPQIQVREVTATRGKWVRAEPIAALYEQGRVSHVGTFAALEDEMCAFGPEGMADGASPDRLDAMVWAMTELFPAMTKRVYSGGPLVHTANADPPSIKGWSEGQHGGRMGASPLPATANLRR